MKGMEIMFAGMLKSLGINPDVVLENLKTLVDAVQVMRADQREILERIKKLENARNDGTAPITEIDAIVIN